MAHFIADYPAQTDWIFRRKLAGWPGLLMHGGVVLVAQGSAVFPENIRLAPIVLAMALIHTLQDRVKIKYGDNWIKGHPIIPYVLDQLLHVALIIGVSFWTRTFNLRNVSPFTQWLALLVTGLVLVTWTYYITWRVALILGDDSYVRSWRWTGKLERTLAFAAGLLNVIYLAPLAFIVRLLVARSRHVSVRDEQYLLFDTILGIIIAAVFGFGIRLLGPF